MCSSHSSHYVFIFKIHPSKSNKTSNSKNISLLSLALSGIPILIRISLYVFLMPTNYERNCSTNLTLMLCQIDGNLYCCGKYPSLMGYNEYNPLRGFFLWLFKLDGWSWREPQMSSSDRTYDVNLHASQLMYRELLLCLSGTERHQGHCNLRGKWITSVML